MIGDYTRSGDLAVKLLDERSNSSDLRTERERRSPKDAVTPSVNGGTSGVSGGGWGESGRSNRRRTRERWREGSRKRKEFGTCCSERSHGYENRACENENGSGVWLTNECELGQRALYFLLVLVLEGKNSCVWICFGLHLSGCVRTFESWTLYRGMDVSIFLTT